MIPPGAFANIGIMLNGMLLKYLLRFEKYQQSGGDLNFFVWAFSRGTDIAISVFCSPMLIWLSSTIMHYLTEMEIDQELLTDRVFYAVGGYAGADVFRWACDSLTKWARWLLGVK